MPTFVFYLPAVLTLVGVVLVAILVQRGQVFDSVWGAPTGDDIARSIGDRITGTIVRTYDGVRVAVPVDLVRRGGTWSVLVGSSWCGPVQGRASRSAVQVASLVRIPFDLLPTATSDDVRRAWRWRTLPTPYVGRTGNGATPTGRVATVRDYAGTAHGHRGAEVLRIASGRPDYLPAPTVAAAQVGAPHRVPALAAVYFYGFGDVA